MQFGCNDVGLLRQGGRMDLRASRQWQLCVLLTPESSCGVLSVRVDPSFLLVTEDWSLVLWFHSYRIDPVDPCFLLVLVVDIHT